MIFGVDLNEVEYSDGLPKNALKQSGVHKGTIQTAKLIEEGESKIIELLFTTDEEQKEAKLYLHIIDKKGKETKAKYKLNAICFLCDIDKDILIPKLMMTKEYDKQRRKVVELERRFYEVLHGKKIRFEIGVVKSYKNGVPKLLYRLIGILHYESGQTATQYRDNLPAIEIKDIKDK